MSHMCDGHGLALKMNKFNNKKLREKERKNEERERRR